MDIVEDGGIRRFSDGKLQASVERVLATLPEGTHAAVVDVGVDAKGVQAVGAVRLGAGWSVMGELERRFDSGDWSGHVQVRWSGR